jgi:hypothetical protein
MFNKDPLAKVLQSHSGAGRNPGFSKVHWTADVTGAAVLLSSARGSKALIFRYALIDALID